MPEQPTRHESGDRNKNRQAHKDHARQRERDADGDQSPDRADEAGTGNREPSSGGMPDVP